MVGVRVGVKNGGCAGMTYTMEYAEDVAKTDEVVEDKGVRVLIDPKAVLFLLGTEMDYKTDKLSAQFVFNNPNQTSACGCGESVQLKPAAECPRPTRRRCVTPDDIVELFSDFGPVTVRRMFGGAGIYADGTMFGLVADGVIYLKAGDSNVAMFEREELAPFTFSKRTGERVVTSYRRMPDRLYDDPEELAVWASAALTRRARATGARKAGEESQAVAGEAGTAEAGITENRRGKKPRSR